MAEFRIFYAWQSDRPANACRSLIRRALVEAAKQLQNEVSFHEALRDGLVIDQDTQGEAGSPQVAETIFRKIRESDAFVADLTLAGVGEGRRESPAPNPNVLIEYGYALRELGEERIIAVFNEEFGNCDDLPFDLRHRRWPIRYRASGGGSGDPSQTTRRSERQKLAGVLASAIRSVLENSGIRKGNSVAADAAPLIERFPLEHGIVFDSIIGRGGLRGFASGAKILLCLRPGRDNVSLTNVDTQRIAREWLKPLASHRLSGWSRARVRDGAAAVANPGSSGAVEFAGILLRDGSLYGVDCRHVGRDERSRVNFPFVPSKAVEDILLDGLRNFLEAAGKGLKLVPPLEVGVGLEGIMNHYLAVDRQSFNDGFRGPLLVDRIEDRFQVDQYGADPLDLLKPFFEKIYDEAGLERP